MSVRVMQWVWENGPSDPTERLVLLAVADYADDFGGCYPSMAGIAGKACVTERGARGIIRRLEQGGWITTKVGGGRGGKSQYRVNMRQNQEAETRNEKPGMRNPEAETRNVEALNPERDCTKPGTSVPPNRQGTIKEPSVIRATLCEVVSEDVADGFIAHRKAKRSKLTEQAASLIAKKLRGNPDADAVVLRSIENGWTGVFPESLKRQAAPPNAQPSVADIFASINARGTA